MFFHCQAFTPLTTTTRNMSVLEMTSHAQEVLLGSPFYRWPEELLSLSAPSFYESTCALFATCAAILFDRGTANALVEAFAVHVMG